MPQYRWAKLKSGQGQVLQCCTYYALAQQLTPIYRMNINSIFAQLL
jgi:hypothetical protein